jgi:hypothetical protein
VGQFIFSRVARYSANINKSSPSPHEFSMILKELGQLLPKTNLPLILTAFADKQ